MPLKVDRSESTAVFEQVAGEIRRAILDGEAKPGERLPPARDLAAELGVNTNTVLRALRLLRDEGLLEFRRGRGVSVAGTPERAAVLEKARELVALSRTHGYRRDELMRIIETLPWLSRKALHLAASGRAWTHPSRGRYHQYLPCETRVPAHAQPLARLLPPYDSPPSTPWGRGSAPGEVRLLVEQPQGVEPVVDVDAGPCRWVLSPARTETPRRTLRRRRRSRPACLTASSRRCCRRRHSW